MKCYYWLSTIFTTWDTALFNRAWLLSFIVLTKLNILQIIYSSKNDDNDDDFGDKSRHITQTGGPWKVEMNAGIAHLKASSQIQRSYWYSLGLQLPTHSTSNNTFHRDVIHQLRVQQKVICLTVNKASEMFLMPALCFFTHNLYSLLHRQHYLLINVSTEKVTVDCGLSYLPSIQPYILYRQEKTPLLFSCINLRKSKQFEWKFQTK